MRIYDCPDGNCNTNFQAIKSTQVLGKNFKKNPELAEYLFKELRENKDFIEFSQKHDLDVALFSKPSDIFPESQLIISWENPYLSKVKKFFNKLSGKKEIIDISGYSNINFEKACLDLSSKIQENLSEERISEINKEFSNFKNYHDKTEHCGVLSGLIKYHSKTMAEQEQDLINKAEKKAAKKEMQQATKNKKNLDEISKNFKDSINL